MHALFVFLYSCLLVDRGKKRDSYKMEVFVKKGGK
jgi:hypothetical protein